MAKQFLLLFFFLFLSLPVFSQRNTLKSSSGVGIPGSVKGQENVERKKKPKAPKAAIDQYRIFTIQKDTTYLDTTLTIGKEYKYNYLRKDNFGLLPFANEGQSYQTLDFGLNEFESFPSMGFQGKHFNFLRAKDMRYYSVATPLTELYFKTVMEQGQSLDAFLTLNTSKNFNFSIAYKGLNSLGKFVNQLSSTGNFRFTTNYHTTDLRYQLKAHFTAQDLSNGENGGIVNNSDFESDDSAFKERARLAVYNEDAKSLLDGSRYFFEHHFRINTTEGTNNLYIDHQFNYEYKFYEYTQPTIASTVLNPNGNGNLVFNRYGASYVTSQIKDKTHYNKMYNKVGTTYENKVLGKFQFFVEDFEYNYFYKTLIIYADGTKIPSSLNDKINTIGGSYTYKKGLWDGTATFSNSISKQAMRNLDVNATFQMDDENSLAFQIQNVSKVPDLVYNLFQSSYKAYNWSNNFNNEKINNIEARATTKWLNAAVQISTLEDKLYFSNISTDKKSVIISPQQYGGTIKYLSLKLSKEFRYGKFALDNTVLYQQVEQNDPIVNVPEFTTRNTFYYSDYLFKRALFLQTGITLNYFTTFYANDYNPVVGDFYIQNQKQIGAFPMLDFFINAKVRQTRIYLKAEHFNSGFTGNDFYSAPSYPYRDFIVRFGLVWNFFQ